MKKILLVNWDNYPNSTTGGVYAWEKALIDNMTEYEFIVVNLLSNPGVNGKYTVPRHVTRVIDLPLFGCYRQEEFQKKVNYSLFLKILRTTGKVVKRKFLPLYEEFLDNVFSNNCDYKKLSDIIFRLHKFLIIYDAKKCIESNCSWDAFVSRINNDRLYKEVSLKNAHFIFQIIQRVIQIFSIEVPQVDMIHCSLSWFPAIVAVFAKKESNCPVMITEHGVAFRDLLLYHSTYLYDGPSNILWKFFSGNIIRAIYSTADVVTPVCYANAKWEEILGADPSKISVLYNGINTEKYRPIEIVPKRAIAITSPVVRPTVVYVGRVEILKDVMNLIQSIKYVKEQIPNVLCLIYGISTDLDYSMQCTEMVRSLNLDENIKFMGNTREPEKAYNTADVIVLSSIAEGFPYSIIEAMACKKVVVSTDVGGVREALGDCGLLVRSRHPHDLAIAIAKLLGDKELRDELGSKAERRVSENFTIGQSIMQYKKRYSELIRLYEGYDRNNELSLAKYR